MVSRLRLTVAGQSHEADVTGAGDGEVVTAEFGSFDIGQVGYCRFELESLNQAGSACGDLDALLLDGPAAQGAHFNLKPRRNAASVHLMDPIPKAIHVNAFYCEMTLGAEWAAPHPAGEPDSRCPRPIRTHSSVQSAIVPAVNSLLAELPV